MGVDRKLWDGHADQGAVLVEPLVGPADLAEVRQTLSGDGDEDQAAIARDGNAGLGAHRGLDGALDQVVPAAQDRGNDRSGIGVIVGKIDDFRGVVRHGPELADWRGVGAGRLFLPGAESNILPGTVSKGGLVIGCAGVANGIAA